MTKHQSDLSPLSHARESLIGASFGNYIVRAYIGEGGMGTVYMAEHPLIGKTVALKVLHPELTHNPRVTKRFLNEARVVNEIRHPHIVDVTDYGHIVRNGQNLVYLVMEYLQGQTLQALIRDNGPVPPVWALAIGMQIAEALHACHERDIVHCDIKPANIMLVECARYLAGKVKLLDFGIAKLSPSSWGVSATGETRVLGTPRYMSPEQCRGRSRIDRRADIYSLGVVLYELLVGQVPFSGHHGAVMAQHLTCSPTPLRALQRDVPAHLEAAVMKALAKNPDQRFASMKEFMNALATPERSSEECRMAASSPMFALPGKPALPWAPTISAEQVADVEPAARSRLARTCIAAALVLALLVMVIYIKTVYTRPLAAAPVLRSPVVHVLDSEPPLRPGVTRDGVTSATHTIALECTAYQTEPVAPGTGQTSSSTQLLLCIDRQSTQGRE